LLQEFRLKYAHVVESVATVTYIATSRLDAKYLTLKIRSRKDYLIPSDSITVLV